MGVKTMGRNTATNTFRLGSIFGVTIAVHFTWFVIFALITFSMTGTFAASFPGLPPATHLLIGVVASLLFFGSVLFHEMAHSLMAIRSGKPVRSITLFIFGGVSEIGKEADRPGEEIRIALIGPVSSYFLAAFFGGVWLLSRGRAPHNRLPDDPGRRLRGISVAQFVQRRVAGISRMVPGPRRRDGMAAGHGRARYRRRHRLRGNEP